MNLIYNTFLTHVKILITHVSYTYCFNLGLTINQQLNLLHFSNLCWNIDKYMCVIPQVSTCAVDH